MHSFYLLNLQPALECYQVRALNLFAICERIFGGPTFLVPFNAVKEGEVFVIHPKYAWLISCFSSIYFDVKHSFGFGAAINCMLPLINVNDVPDDNVHADYGLTRSRVSSLSPGAGAFTPYNGRRFLATTKIEPFSELYADYGEDYFSSRDAYATVPLFRDYVLADTFVGNYLRRLQDLRTKIETVSANELKKPPLDILESTTLQKDVWNFVTEAKEVWKSRTLHALSGQNTTLNDLQLLMDSGGTKMLHYNNSIRSREWMEEHGQCMDNIKNAISRIPHAGRGAFATRFIAQGGLVAPSPLIHIPNRATLTVYQSMETSTDRVGRNTSAPTHHQLLLNYCFGHRESTVLLCPYGMLTSLINHDSLNSNTRIVWSHSSRMRHPEWLEKPVAEWGNSNHAGLVMEYIALRDIEENEEIIIDYGDDWTLAWQEHAARFIPHRKSYVPAFELNRLKYLRIPTVNETEAQFEGVLTTCDEHYFPDNHGINPHRRGFEGEHRFDDYYLCSVLERHSDNNYTALVKSRRDVDGTLTLSDLPREAFIFKDIPYERDHHQTWSFRHDMRVPDDVFPAAWKNDPKGEKGSFPKFEKVCEVQT